MDLYQAQLRNRDDYVLRTLKYVPLTSIMVILRAAFSDQRVSRHSSWARLAEMDAVITNADGTLLTELIRSLKSLSEPCDYLERPNKSINTYLRSKYGSHLASGRA